MQRIAIGCVTRQRPKMFGWALKSLSRIQAPEGCQLVFIFVENDAELSIEGQIERFKGFAPNAEVLFALEPKLGIPNARNCVLEMALAAGCDQLAFIDDDEIVDRDWLVKLHGVMRERKLGLVGGPVIALRPEEKLTILQRTVWSGVKKRAKRIRRTASKLAKAGLDGKVAVVTNNWLCDLDFLRKTGLRFDGSMGVSKGSDSVFFREFKKLGGKSGWASFAFVREVTPLSRLTLGYQFQRGRDDTLASFTHRYTTLGIGVVLRSAMFILSKLILGLGRLVLCLLDGGRSLALAMRAFGAAVGRFDGLMGRKSTHYKTTHGS